MIKFFTFGLLRGLIILIVIHSGLGVPISEHDDYYNSAHEEVKIKKNDQDLSKVPGIPGIDYPIFHDIPETNFHCKSTPALPGMYADVETGCQAYHVCHDGREGHQGASFLCSNGTLFNQKEFTCDWWYNVNCAQSLELYHLNADPEHNPFIPKKKPEELSGKLLIHAN